MLAIFEFSYGMLNLFIFGYVTKGSTFATLIQAMALNMVLLPFSFLMNTTDNKSRIVEIGWENVFRNIVNGWINPAMRILPMIQSNNRISNSSIPMNNDITNEMKTDGLQDKQQPESIKSKKKPRRKSSKSVKKMKDRCGVVALTAAEQPIDKNSDKIFIISTFHKSVDSNPIENDGPDLNVPFHEKPSTSYKENTQFITCIDSDDESLYFYNPKEKNIARLDTYQAIAQSMIQIMKDSMEHEYLYLHYLKKLFELHQNMSDSNEIDISNMEQTFDVSQDKNLSECNVHELKLKGAKSERNEMRSGLLEKLDLCYQTKQNDDILISELTDLEESFIDD